MSISNALYGQIIYEADGVQTAFPVNFSFKNVDDLVVSVRLADDAVPSVLTFATDYTLSGNYVESEGVVTFVAAPALGVSVIIRRQTTPRQTLPLATTANFRSETVEKALDDLARQIGDTRALANKTIRLDAEDADPFQLPPAGGRIDKLVGFDESGAGRLLAISDFKGAPARVDLFGTFAGRDDYDLSSEGVTYLATDLDPPLIYFKQSEADGDWSDGLVWGRGPKGDSGESAPLTGRLTAGQVLPEMSDTLPSAEYLWANHETIGDIGSGADHESADYFDAFERLKGTHWNNGDESWSAGDTVNLPDLREVVMVGRGAMGGAASPSRIQRASTLDTTADSDQATVGSATGLVVGMFVLGNANVPDDTVISAIDGTTLTLSANATVTASTVTTRFSVLSDPDETGSLGGLTAGQLLQGDASGETASPHPFLPPVLVCNFIVYVAPAQGGPTIVPLSAGDRVWQFDATTTEAAPGSGVFRLDDVPDQASALYIDDQDAAGVDLSSLWLAVPEGSILGIYDLTRRGSFASFTTGLPVDETGYVKIPLTYIAGAATGSIANGDNCALSVGRPGQQGIQGVAGTDPGLLYSFDTATADADQGNGALWADNAALDSATFVYVSKTTRGGSDASAVLLGLADSTNPTNKGTLILTDPATEKQAFFTLASITNATDYVKLAVTGHSGATAFADDLALSLQLMRTGDTGADGDGSVTSVNNIAPISGNVTVDADDIAFDPAGNDLTATDVQAAIVEAAEHSAVKLGGTSIVTALDEDDMATDSATAVATQQSVKAYVDGEIASIPTAAGGKPTATLRDEKPVGTHGDAAVSGIQTRPLNTEDDPDGIVTLSSNQFTPSVDCFARGIMMAYKTNGTTAFFYCTTDAAIVGHSMSGHSWSSSATNALAECAADLESGKTYELRMDAHSAASRGMGNSHSHPSQPNTYARVELWS